MANPSNIWRQEAVAKRNIERQRKAEQKHDFVYIYGKAYNIDLSKLPDSERQKFAGMSDADKIAYLSKAGQPGGPSGAFQPGAFMGVERIIPGQTIQPGAMMGVERIVTPPAPTAEQWAYKTALMEGPQEVKRFVDQMFTDAKREAETFDYAARHPMGGAQFGVVAAPPAQPRGGIYVPPGMSKEQYAKVTNQRIQNLVKARLQEQQVKTLQRYAPNLTKEQITEITTPRYIMIGAPGAEKPVALNQAAKDSDYINLIASDAPWYVKGMAVLGRVGEGLLFLSKPAGWAEGYISENETPQVVPALMQVGLNAAMYGVEFMRYTYRRMIVNQNPVYVEQLRKNAAALQADPNATPEQKQAALKLVADADRATTISQNAMRDMDVATKALQRSWDILNRARETSDILTAYSRDPKQQAKTIAAINAFENQNRMEQTQSDVLRNSAFQQYRAGNAGAALGSMIESLRHEMAANVGGPLNTYTWTREPDRLESFLHDVAQAELQLNRPLTEDELLRVRQYHENPWTEMVGQTIFDPLWMVPQKVWDIPMNAIKYMGAGVVKGMRAVEVFGGHPLNWVIETMTRRTIASASYEMESTIADILGKASVAEMDSKGMVSFLDKVSEVSVAISGESGARKGTAYARALKAVGTDGKLMFPEFQNLTYEEFTKLVTALSPKQGAVDPLEWGRYMNDVYESASDHAIELATRKVEHDTRLAGKVLSDAEKARMVQAMAQNWLKNPRIGGQYIIGQFAGRVAGAFKDSYRVIAGSAVYSDSISGKLLQFLLDKGGAEKFGLSAAKRAIVTGGTKATESVALRKLSVGAAYSLYGLMGVADFFRNIWTMSVLSLNPRWVLINYMDSSMRSMVYGGGMFDGVVDMAYNLQKHMADELGVVPIGLSQSLARNELNFGDRIYSRMVFDEWKPGVNIFAYFQYEFNRLKPRLSTVELEAERLSRLGDSPLKKALTGLNLLGSDLWKGMKSIPAGMSDFNTAIEFTLRLRMFHDEYFRALATLEPEVMSRGMDALSPEMQMVAKQIWKQSGGNPARLRALADSLVTGKGKGWSLLMPPDLEKTLGQMGTSDQALIINNINDQLENLVIDIRRHGREPKEADFIKFFDDYRVALTSEFNARHSANFQTKGISMTPGGMSSVPTEATVHTAPQFGQEAQSLEKAAASLKHVQRKQPFQTNQNIIDNVAAALSPIATVVKPQRGALTKVYMEGDAVIVQLGEQALKGNQTELYNTLLDSSIRAMRLRDAEALGAVFHTGDEYENLMRVFIKDPTEALTKDEAGFVAIVRQLEDNPYFDDVVRRLSGERMNYEPAFQLYRQHKEIEYLPGWQRDLIQRAEEQAKKLVRKPAQLYISASKADVSFGKLNSFIQRMESENPAIANAAVTLRDRWGMVRAQYFDFMHFHYPGPLLLKRGNGDVPAAWALVYEMTGHSYETQARLTDDFLKMYSKNPERAQKWLDDFNASFTDRFLQEHGITVTWDAEHKFILEATFKNPVTGARAQRWDKRTLDNLQAWMYGREIENAMQKNILRMSDATRQATIAIFQDAAHTTRKQAESWANVLSEHARMWAETTHQPVESYFERLGITSMAPSARVVTSGKSKVINRLTSERLIGLGGNAVVKKTPDGRYVFYALDQATFGDLVRELSVMFLDDMQEMRKFNSAAYADWETIRKVLGVQGNLTIEDKHYVKFAALYTDYLRTGYSSDIGLKRAFEKYSEWLAPLSHVALDEGAAEDVNAALQRLSLRSGIPTQRGDTVKALLEESNLTEEELLQQLQLNGSSQGIPGVENIDSFLLYAKKKGLEAEAARKIWMERGMGEMNPIYRDFVLDTPAQASPEDIAKAIASAPKSVSEYTLKDIHQAINDLRGPTHGIPERVNEAFLAWRNDVRFDYMSAENMSSIDSFKAAMREAIDHNWSASSRTYEQWLWEVEQLESAIVSLGPKGIVTKEVLFPKLTMAHLDDGAQVWVRNNEMLTGQYENALKLVDYWDNYMRSLVDSGGMPKTMVRAEGEKFKKWAEQAAKAKAQMISAVVDGGKVGNHTLEGAVNKVNRIMIDYNYQNNVDRIMRNFFPFWTFPSRSFPFWAETIATHPELIAIYNRVQRMSEDFRYQHNMINSRGEPLKSFEGYIPIPGVTGSNGETLWFNPLAPFSFRYVLDMPDRMGYSAETFSQNRNDLEPMAAMTKEFFDASNIFGFSLAPWVLYPAKAALHIPDNVLPRMALTPQLALALPKWIVPNYIQNGRRIMFYGWRDVLNPEVQGHDYLVEREILMNAYAKMMDPNISEDEKQKVVLDANAALGGVYDSSSGLSETEWYIQRRQTPLWKSTEDELYKQEWGRNAFSMFSGIFVKPYSDNYADFNYLRNQVMLLRSAMNNYYQAKLFDLPTSPTGLDDLYNNFQDTPEGWLMRLYTDAGWVTDENSHLISDPMERAKYLALKIEQDNIQQTRYAAMKDLSKQMQTKLTQIPVGSDYELYRPIYDWYNGMYDFIDNAYPSTYERRYGTWRNFQSIQQEVTDIWYREINMSKPVWDYEGGETYIQYKQRMAEWEVRIPKIAQQLFGSFMRTERVGSIVNSLHPEQTELFQPDVFFQNLLTTTNIQGYNEWRKVNDTVYDAMNRAYEETYWQPFWQAHSNTDGTLLSGSAFDLATEQFNRVHPGGPTPDELYQYILTNYGPDFTTQKEVNYIFNNTGEVTAQQRQEQTWSDTKKQQQSIWSLLSLAGPGKGNEQLKKEFLKNLPADASIDSDSIDAWYKSEGLLYQNDPTRLDTFLRTLTLSVNKLGMTSPTEQQLKDYVLAERQNEEFHQAVMGVIADKRKVNMSWEFFSENVMGVYYNPAMDKASKKDWVRANPDLYGAIKTYNQFRYNDWKKGHPIWAIYYLGEGLPKYPSTETPTTNFPMQQVVKTSKGETPPVAQPQAGTAQPASKPSPGIFSPSLTLAYPIGFREAVGSSMLKEINNRYYKNYRLSGAAETFLRKLSTRHPEWGSFINSVLYRP